MSFLGPTSDPKRKRLIEVRNTLLDLHKALIDSEREAYEQEYGPVVSAASFLQMLINDARFDWLRPLTSLVVDVDETLAARVPAGEDDLDRMLTRAEQLLSTPENDEQFGAKYARACNRDSQASLLHAEVKHLFAAK